MEIKSAEGSATRRDRFPVILEQTRKRYRLVVVGYVVMPEHIHRLLSEPEIGTPSTVMQVLKQRSARALLSRREKVDERQASLFGEVSTRAPFWQARFYDFNVWTDRKKVEKLRLLAARGPEGFAGRFHALGLALGFCLLGRRVEENFSLVAVFGYTVALRVEARQDHQSRAVLVFH